MKHILTLILLALPALAQITSINAVVPTGALSHSTVNVASASGITIKSATDKMAFKFFPATTNPIVSADLNLAVFGTLTGITLKFHIETNSSDAPSGTVLGSSTAPFSPPGAAGWTDLKTLGSDTGALTLNTPYWLVVEDGGGTAPTSSNYTQGRYLSVPGQTMGGRLKGYTASAWGSPIAGDPVIVLKDSANNIYGIPATAALISSTTSLYGTNQDGVRFQIGSTAVIRGVQLRIAFSGTPADGLEVALMSGGSTTPIATAQIALSSIITNNVYTLYFSSGQTLTAGTDYYLMVRQANGAGTAGNYYTIGVTGVPSAYLSAGIGSAFVKVNGSTATIPSSLTTSSSYIPYVVPLLGDASTDLSGSGGAAPVTVIY